MGYIDGVSGGVGLKGGNVYSYNGLIFEYDFDPIEQIVIDYFSTDNSVYDDIYTAIHVQDSTKDPVFQMSSHEVGQALKADDMISYTEYVVNLVNAGIPTLIFAGEYDFRDGAKA